MCNVNRRYQERPTHSVIQVHPLAAAMLGLALLLSVGLAFGLAVRAGVVPVFDEQIGLPGEGKLIIHNGFKSTCASAANPPQHDCYTPEPGRREFSVDYVTSSGDWSLLWFQIVEPR